MATDIVTGTNNEDLPETTTIPSNIKLKVEFTGGLELLFNNTRSHTLLLPQACPSSSPTVADLIAHLSRKFHANLPKARRDLFSLDPDLEQDMQDTGDVGEDADGLRKDADGNRRKGMTVRPGILVLVNDADWELEEERETKLEAGDEVVFVSTLHGG